MLIFSYPRLARAGILVGALFSAHCATDDSGAPPDEVGDAAPTARDASVGEAGARDAALARDASTSDAAIARDAGGARDGGAVDGGSARDGAVDAAPASDAGATTPDDAGSGASETTTAIASAPSYLGTTASDSACSATYRTMGFVPRAASPAKHPLFLYFVGTAGGAADESAKYDCKAAKKVTEAMARRGFVALSVEYDNQIASIFTNKTSCLYDAANPRNLLAAACALPSVDCSLGIATWGHSQGALIAHVAANFDARVRAVWTTGYSGIDGAKLPVSRLRAVNGEADTLNAPVGHRQQDRRLHQWRLPRRRPRPVPARRWQRLDRRPQGRLQGDRGRPLLVQQALVQ